MSPRSSSCLACFAEVEPSDPGLTPPWEAPVASRMPKFIGVDDSALEILRRLKILFVGVGSVGGRIADHAARFQPAQAWIIDPASFKAESLATHSITMEHIGEPKAIHTARRFKSLSPDTRVHVFRGRFQDINQLAIQDADVVVLATDNLAVEVSVAECCMHLAKPLIQGSVYGDALVAQVRIVANEDPRDGCLACGYGEQDWDHYRRETSFSCTGNGGAAATMSTSSLCSVAADLVSVELLRQALRLGEPVMDSLLEYCGYTQTITRSRLMRNDQCPCSHIAWELATPPQPLCDCSLNELLHASGLATTGEPVTFDVAGHDFIEMAVCCGMQQVRRFVTAGESAGYCELCDQPLPSARLFSKARVTASNLSSLMTEPLSRIGAASAHWVVVESCDRAVVFQ